MAAAGAPQNGRTPTGARAAARASWLYPLLWAFLVPALLGVFAPGLAYVSKVGFVVAAAVLLLVTLIKAYVQWYTSSGGALSHLRRSFLMLPPFVAVGTDLDESEFPWCTILLVSLNVAAFAFVPDEWTEALCFPPVGDHSTTHLILSAFSSAFLHANFKHLFVNMAFLWTFGSALESRMGRLRLLAGYFLVLASSQAVTFLLAAQRAEQWGSLPFFREFHSLGSSGAVFGLMAFFIVRCFFARVTIGLPLLFLPVGAVRARVPGLILVAFYVLYNTVGGIYQLGPFSTGTNYWSHMGGYLGGFVLAYLMGLHREALGEAMIAKAERLRKVSHKTGETSGLYHEILEKDPENESALRYFLDRYHVINQEKALPYYQRLVRVLLKQDIRKAAAFVDAYPSSFTLTLAGDVLFRLGMHHYREFRMEKAEALLRGAAMEPGPWQAKALLSLAETLHVLGRDREAEEVLSEVVRRFPDESFSSVALKKLNDSHAAFKPSR